MVALDDNQKRLARQWAVLAKNFEVSSREQQAAAEYILATTESETMADVRWDHDTMPGTGALTENGDLWIMRDDAGDSIDCISPDLVEIAFVAKDFLTPNGKRYELREVPDHPEMLTTVLDYESAPVGTVVEGKGKLPWTRLEYVWKETAGTKASDVHMAGEPRRVLRWGWGDKA